MSECRVMSREDVVIEVRGGDTMCPICGQIAVTFEQRGENWITFAADPRDDWAASLGFRVPSETTRPASYRFTFGPCGDEILTAASPLQSQKAP